MMVSVHKKVSKKSLQKFYKKSTYLPKVYKSTKSLQKFYQQSVYLQNIYE
jgi:hypothetical protein